MNPNLTCPKCGGQLEVEHYRTWYKFAMYVLQSRLVCKNLVVTADNGIDVRFKEVCGYKKEWPAPKELFSLTRVFKGIDQKKEREVAGMLAGGEM